mmetsp:Transcript_26492/g.29302  ORF Transcript_26492/g.29302 Transcript_26492/m.29302 type:complete len:333 (-) Transcript_26492:61-1059(-)
MSRVSTAAAIEIQSCFRIALARKAARVLFARHQEERTFSAIIIQSLFRLNIVKRRFERSISSAIAIQCFFRVMIAKKRREEAVHFHHNRPHWSSCFKVMALVGIITVGLCSLIHSIFIYSYSNSINNSMGIDTNNRIILSQMKDESDESVLEAIEGTLKIKALNSGGIDELYEMSTALQNNNNNSEILDDVWRKKSRLRDIIVAKEESNRDIFMENVIAIGQEKIEFGMAMEEVIVEVSHERNASIDNELDLLGSERILSEWKGTLMREETSLFPIDDGNKMYHLMVSPDLEEEYFGEYDESQDHSEIVKVFAEQFRMEHAFSVQNFGSDYI